MSERGRFLVLIAIMVAVALITTATAIRILYIAAVTEEQHRLVEMAQSQARLIEAVARFNAVYSHDYPAGARQATLNQIVDAHSQYKGFGETGEFTLAQLAADSIVFLLSHRHYDLEHPRPVPFDSELAEPMRRALSGESGTLKGLDYRGQFVLAAYEPVGELDLGIVAKIDMAEIRAPFWRAGMVVAVIAVLVTTLGGWVSLKVSNPIIARLEGSVARSQKSEKRYRLLFNSGDDAIFVYHLLDDGPGKFIEVNGIACKRLGYSYEELLDLTPRDINKVEPSFIQNQLKRLRQEKHAIFESIHITKNRSEIPVEINAHLFDLSGSPTILSVARDITERRRAEAERERLLSTLKEKNDDLEEIVHISSHDLRSPLVNIAGFAGVIDENIEQAVETLSGRGKKDAALGQLQHLLEIDTRKAVEHISRGARRMESLISGLLRLMRLGKMEVEIQRLDMNVLLGEIMQSFSYRVAQAGVEVEIGDLPSCCGDRLQIGQVFSNLLDNALKYLDTERSGVIRVSGQQNGRLVEYCVEDNGIGIAPENNDRVFQLFHRMNPSKTTGEGVGLTLIKKIIDRHGGQVRLESKPGAGSRFYVSLPVKAGGEQ